MPRRQVAGVRVVIQGVVAERCSVARAPFSPGCHIPASPRSHLMRGSSSSVVRGRLPGNLRQAGAVGSGIGAIASSRARKLRQKV